MKAHAERAGEVWDAPTNQGSLVGLPILSQSKWPLKFPANFKPIIRKRPELFADLIRALKDVGIGVFCHWTRPFTNNYPVGELSEEIIPTEFKDEKLVAKEKERL